TELDEVLELADRIAVMYHGRIVGIVPGDTSRETLGLMMAGQTPDDAALASGADVAAGTPGTAGAAPAAHPTTEGERP
ncbi:heme ABC transporter ATP-binding protein, partial [Xanthomonas citri pv. citri]|nr:heme ABC transporter ATP-binding protein [Xanthomonas citri pv. citri]